MENLSQSLHIIDSHGSFIGSDRQMKAFARMKAHKSRADINRIAKDQCNPLTSKPLTYSPSMVKVLVFCLVLVPKILMSPPSRTAAIYSSVLL